MTLSEKLDLTAGRPAGFDYLRILLALAVFFWHSILTTYGSDHQFIKNPWFFSFVVWVLPSFFALSGFLVAGSLQRCKTIAGFLYLRVIRIFPALIIEITLSALILGPVLTELPIGSYFKDPQLRLYFFNCIGYIHYHLPGVFAYVPDAGIVNAQLWTIPFELKCYIVIAVLAVAGVSYNRWLLLVAVLTIYGFHAFTSLDHLDVHLGLDRGNDLVVAFLFGVLFYYFRGLVPHNAALAAFAFVLGACLFLVPVGRPFSPLPVAYVIVYLGLTNPRRLSILETGDYSYGIYLYSFPIQQAVVASGWVPVNPLLDFAVSVPFVLLFAACSWHFWEKHCLEMRRFRPLIDKWFSFTKPGRIVGHIYRLAASVSS